MLSIRPASLSDIPAITRTYGESRHNGHGQPSSLKPPVEAADGGADAASHRPSGYPYLAADMDGVFAGYAYAGAYRVRPAYRFTVENSVYIAPAMQRCGVGRALLDALIAECATRGFRQMIAVIGDLTNQAGSVALHKAAGFRVTGTLDDVGFKHGRWLDLLLMQRALGNGASEAPV